MTKTPPPTPSCELVLIAMENIGRVWPLVEPFLEKGLEQMLGEFSMDQLREMLEVGRMQLWIVDDKRRIVAVGVTEMVPYPALARVRVVLVGGKDMASWVGLLPKLEQWAVSLGATGIEAYVRPGMAKALEQHGFTVPYRIAFRSLKHLLN